MEEDKGGNNGEVKSGENPQFKQFIKIFFNDETGNYAFETNVPNAILGYGMLEFGKKGIDNHLARAQQKQVIAGGGILNFARRLVK